MFHALNFALLHDGARNQSLGIECHGRGHGCDHQFFHRITG
jgi:hypothetical protein